jgi:hypothetical protein
VYRLAIIASQIEADAIYLSIGVTLSLSLPLPSNLT